jgi:hypothetical protein
MFARHFHTLCVKCNETNRCHYYHSDVYQVLTLSQQLPE